MTFQIETPSWLTSWIAWRNYYTSPGSMPFNLLMEELGADTKDGLSLLYERKHEICPHCKGEYVVQDDTWGIIYCICQVLPFQERQRTKFADIRSDTTPARLSDLELPDEIGAIGIRSLKRGIAKVEQFIKRPDRWLVITGPVGTGKTHMLRAIDTALYPMSVYVASRDLENMVHEYRKNDNLTELYRLLRYAPVLLIDDLGMEYGGELMASIVDRVVDARYARFPDYPLVVATNLRYSDLPGYVERSADRLMDNARTDFIGLNGTSYRLLKRGAE